MCLFVILNDDSHYILIMCHYVLKYGNDIFCTRVMKISLIVMEKMLYAKKCNGLKIAFIVFYTLHFRMIYILVMFLIVYVRLGFYSIWWVSKLC